MLTKEQLAARKCGGSDIATILGLNAYKTELELYFEKIGEIPPEDLTDNEHVAAGNLLEDGIANLTQWHLTRAWSKEVKLRRCNLTLVHPKYDWLTAHIDRDVVGLERGVELKNVGPFSARFWGQAGAADGVPTLYKPQVHTYMLVKDYPVWTVAGYFGGGDLRLYELERSKEWDELIVESTHEFWHNHVLKGIPPDDAGVPLRRRIEVAKRVYPGTTGEFLTVADFDERRVVIPLDDGQFREVTLDEARRLYEVACAGEKANKARAEELKGALLLLMGNAAILQFSDGSSLVRKEQKRKAYTVEASTHIDSRFKKPKKGKEEAADEE